MKHERLFFVIFLASVFLLATVGLEAEGGTARTELEKKGYAYNESSFVECAKKGDVDAVKLFLAEGIDTNAMNERGQTALIRAAEYQRTEVVTLLLGKGVDVNFVGGRYARTALMEAAGTGNCVIIKQLAEKGAEINAKDYESTTPLHFACMYGHVEAVRLLIELGAKPDVKAAGLGRTPMSLAETNGYVEIVQILKDAGAKE
jgi:ankyrin repeat protein